MTDAEKTLAQTSGPEWTPPNANRNAKIPLLPPGMIFGFCLVTILFPLWGFPNDITNPLVKAFGDIFLISTTQSSLVQTAFYGGYATMAIPAAIFIRRYSYKSGILVGLILYALGAFLFIPATYFENFWYFLLALYILTFGLAFLETTANPYILSMGDERTATRRLNFAQAFNPMGSLLGMAVASLFVLANLSVTEYRGERGDVYNCALNQAAAYSETASESQPAFLEKLNADRQSAENTAAAQANRKPKTLVPVTAVDMEKMIQVLADSHGDTWKQKEAMNELITEDLHGLQQTDPQRYETTKTHDLQFVRFPYVTLGCVVLVIFLVFLVSKLPDTSGGDHQVRFFETFGRLVRNPSYLGGVVAQTFYVGAQIMCWTYIIHYAMAYLGMDAATAQNWNILAMVIFCSSRFICTYMLKFISPGRLLLLLALGGVATTLGTIYLDGYAGLYCLVAISACMSLMFPTIYGIALDGLGEDAKLGSAGLIFAIVGGALMPPLQGYLIDDWGVRLSFFLPLACFVVIAVYGLIAIAQRRRTIADASCHHSTP